MAFNEFFTEPEASPEKLLLESYEILPCEPLCDVKGHILNLFEEIPYHVTNKKETPSKGNRLCNGRKEL